MNTKIQNRVNRDHSRSLHPAGFEILEIVISLGLISMMFIVMLSLKSTTQLQQNAVYRSLATQLIVEESEALRDASFASLYNRTNQPFAEVAYTIGNWAVATPQVACSSGCSGAHAYTVQGVTGAFSPSRTLVPVGKVGDGTYEIHVRPQTGSAAGWKAGFYVHFHDAQNYYLLRMNSANSKLEFLKVAQGAAPTTVWSTAQVFSNSWYDLKAVATGTSYKFYLNGIDLTSAGAVTDTAYTTGTYLLYAESGAVADFEDVTFTNTATPAATLLWNFDRATDTLANAPYGWRRTTPTDLPSGATSLTVADYTYNNNTNTATDLKAATVTVSWSERNGTKSVTNTFYLNQQSLAP